jgi:predicted  nucleic acid-binding Zn-ribbon protein
MNTEKSGERCSACNCVLREDGQSGYQPLMVPERNKEIVLQHCPSCGTLLIHIETVPAQTR